ncbi:FAD-dependent oxidoreductase [Roseomonas sp. CCTCC AB2023176]|uniref:FAD/NAD(P)-dependent oxidoreductase n=1 Tax=Roseomonas sp. CCTCC AB2023176 TaxID=3342640 RepID=UPI0035E088BC
MKVVVVGAGPAGTRAVEALVEHGLSPVWIEEGPTSGGRIYQRPPAGFTRSHRDLYGFEARRAQSLHAAADAARMKADWRPDTLVWNIRRTANLIDTLAAGTDRAEVPFDAAILCTGAMDRVIPIPGWTLPGVTTVGGAQVALKTQGAAIGRRVAFVGTGPLLWYCAHQYRKAGAEVAAVVDTTPFATKAAAAPRMLLGPATFAKGLYYVAALRAARVPVFEGATPRAITGDTAVGAVHFTDAGGKDHAIACDAVAMGWHLKPEAQLADLAGIPFRFDHSGHAWVPERDAVGRTARAGIYLAGDGAGIAGADAAELAGRRAAFALMADHGMTVDGGEAARLDRVLAWQSRFRAALDAAFPFPAHLAAAMPDDTILCRCESVTAGDLRAAASESAATGAAPEVNRAKAFSRVGMGRCQGRVCGPPAAEVLAAALGCTVEEVGRLRGQPPVKPVPVAVPA